MLKVKTMKVIEVSFENKELRKSVKDECGHYNSNTNFIYTIELRKNSFNFLDLLEPLGFGIGDVVHFRLLW